MPLIERKHFRGPPQPNNQSRAKRRSLGTRAWPAAWLLLVAAPMTVALVTAAVPAKAESLKSAAAKILNARGCVACHYIPGVPEAKGTTGPSLKKLNDRPRIVGGVLENTEENMRDWLKNPKEIKPNTMMPDLGLSDQDIDILINFFKTI